MNSTLKNFVTDSSIIKIQIIKLFDNNNKATIAVNVKTGKKQVSFAVDAYCQAPFKYWLTYVRQFKNEDGSIIGEMTGYQRFLQKQGIVDTPITNLTFTSINNGNSYLDCPVTLTCSGNSWSIRMVNKPSYRVKRIYDPNTGQTYKRVFPKKTKTGEPAYIAPSYYKRLHVNSLTNIPDFVVT